MTKIRQKNRITIVDGKLCIQYYLLLQQLTYQKKLKDNTYKQYVSYHIKFPKTLYELIGKQNKVYLEKQENKLILHTEDNENYRKINIQKTRKNDDIGYQLTIPQKLLKIQEYKRGKTYILCQTIAADNKEGYIITLELLL